jgi:hypothetical protein
VTAPPPPPLVTSLIRTWAPMLAGWMISLPLAQPVLDALGADTPTATRVVTGAVVSVAGAAYYTAVRLAERRWPAFGALLGRAAEPMYAKPVGAGRHPTID